eukprot:XP_017455892.1 PREDICTED: uncharacterized protein LOC108353096 [Rattus norvegicus]
MKTIWHPGPRFYLSLPRRLQVLSVTAHGKAGSVRLTQRLAPPQTFQSTAKPYRPATLLRTSRPPSGGLDHREEPRAREPATQRDSQAREASPGYLRVSTATKRRNQAALLGRKPTRACFQRHSKAKAGQVRPHPHPQLPLVSERWVGGWGMRRSPPGQPEVNEDLSLDLPSLPLLLSPHFYRHQDSHPTTQQEDQGQPWLHRESEDSMGYKKPSLKTKQGLAVLVHLGGRDPRMSWVLQ